MTTLDVAATQSSAEADLRRVLQLNGALSTTTGLIGLLLGGWVAEQLGVDQAWLIRLLGAGLVGFAAFVIFISRSQPSTLKTWSAQISLADIGWMIGTIAVIALGWLSTTGAVVMLLIGFVVLGLGLTQWKLRSEL